MNFSIIDYWEFQLLYYKSIKIKIEWPRLVCLYRWKYINRSNGFKLVVIDIRFCIIIVIYTIGNKFINPSSLSLIRLLEHQIFKTVTWRIKIIILDNKSLIILIIIIFIIEICLSWRKKEWYFLLLFFISQIPEKMNIFLSFVQFRGHFSIDQELQGVSWFLILNTYTLNSQIYFISNIYSQSMKTLLWTEKGSKLLV